MDIGLVGFTKLYEFYLSYGPCSCHDGPVAGGVIEWFSGLFVAVHVVHFDKYSLESKCW